MDPLLGRVALQAGLMVFILGLIPLPFLEPNSPEFVIDVLGLAVSGTFLLLVRGSVRRRQAAERERAEHGTSSSESEG